MQDSTRGFTLIELLVVIAIVAVLAVSVLLTLNPAQLLRQARDSNRVQDLGTLKSAISFYLADATSTSMGTSTLCYVYSDPGGSNCGSRFSGGTTDDTASLDIDGTGWVPIDFTDISPGAPISALPVDPVNNTTYYYAYRPNPSAGTFEVNANMESTKFASGGSSDVESTDGGDSNTIFEAGNEPGLDL